jgi:NADPH-dependent glutamate synthase beta subunit-like oxidoreductase/NAD-dependent dihydropyrimidine dehydrogenase PreA subunit
LAITSSDLQPQFKFEVSRMPGGKPVKQCFDCGSCSGICPVNKSEPDFDPRKILHMIKLGLKSRLLGSEFLWYCSHCDTCLFVCPQNVRFSDIVDVLRDLAINGGHTDSKAFEQWGTAPCKASCPAHISIQGFVGAIADGRYVDGLKLIKEEMPFPATCGRVCHHPCETQCSLSSVDKPIAIEFLKRFLADLDLFSETPYVPKTKEKKEKKVAVIGAGPAGLTVAYFLAIEGYLVTIYERLPVAGGMMAIGIPEYRLPRKILQAEIDIIKKLDVDIRLNCEIGKNLSLDDLHREYNAIFVGAGCHRAMKLGIPGEEDLEGVIDCITFLRDINLGNLPNYKGRLVIIGGGNAAVDCARVGIRLGFIDVNILYRRTRKEMPAIQEEIKQAIEEGVDIQPLTAPVRFLGKNGNVTGVELIRMSLGEPDESGRPRPIRIKGSEFMVQADVVIVAAGQAPEVSFLTDSCSLRFSNRNLIEVDPISGATNIPGIFAGGDIVAGPRTVVEAIASGKKAAISIDRYLKGLDILAGRHREWKGCEFMPENIELKERECMPCLPLEERNNTFKEIAQGFNEEQARSEAGRCYRICGIQK